MAELISRDKIHDIIAVAYSGYLTDETREALEKIDVDVADLPTAYITHGGDLISREEAFKDITTGLCSDITCEECSFAVGDICVAAKWLCQLPPVATPTSESTAGHWIYKQYDEETGISNTCWCSECNKPLVSAYKNFCANCGAKMVEPQESEDKG